MCLFFITLLVLKFWHHKVRVASEAERTNTVCILSSIDVIVMKGVDWVNIGAERYQNHILQTREDTKLVL